MPPVGYVNILRDKHRGDDILLRIFEGISRLSALGTRPNQLVLIGHSYSRCSFQIFATLLRDSDFYAY